MLITNEKIARLKAPAPLAGKLGKYPIPARENRSKMNLQDADGVQSSGTCEYSAHGKTRQILIEGATSPVLRTAGETGKVLRRQRGLLFAREKSEWVELECIRRGSDVNHSKAEFTRFESCGRDDERLN